MVQFENPSLSYNLYCKPKYVVNVLSHP